LSHKTSATIQRRFALTFKQFLELFLSRAMKSQRGKKRLRKKKAKKVLVRRWGFLEEIRLLDERKRAAITILEAEAILYKHLEMEPEPEPKDNYFSSLLMGSAMESAMGAATDAFCSIPRPGYPTQTIEP
jgi:hypothetical protein